MPLEEEAERLGGKLPDGGRSPRSSAQAIDAGLNGGMHAREHGGQGWTRLEWALVEEQYGRTTNAIHWHVPQAYNVWAHASAEQIDRYLRPALRGELKDAYAVTERDAGSDPSAIAATAERTDAGFRLNAREVVRDRGRRRRRLRGDGERDRRAPSGCRPCSWSTRPPGVEIVDNPAFTHNYPEGHPTIRFTRRRGRARTT